MSMLLHTLPHRRRSRRRTRNLRARLLIGGIVLLATAYCVWTSQPPPMGALPMSDAGLAAAAHRGPEPEQSIDTEGALADADAARYVAER